MKKVMTAAFAASALFAASGKIHADVNYPWCLLGDTRGYECVFSSREQCAQDGRNRGFGGQCIQNPAYKPGRPPTVSGNRPVPQTARPSQAVSAAHSTCSGLKLACLSGERCLRMGGELVICGGGTLCGSTWEQCMKTGWWQTHIQAERR
jgi:Protein of unknown function (DUF3551)